MINKCVYFKPTNKQTNKQLPRREGENEEGEEGGDSLLMMGGGGGGGSLDTDIS